MPPDRHYDVTREVDLIEEVGRVHGIDEHLPTTLPGGRRPGRRAEPRAAAAAAGRGRPPRPRLRPGRRLELHRPRRGRPAADRRRRPARRPGRCSPTRSPRSSRRCGRWCSARCSTSPPATAPAAPTASPSSRPAAVYLRAPAHRRRDAPTGRRLGRRNARPATVSRARAAPVTEPHRYRRRSPCGPLAARSWRGEGEPARLLRAEGRARGARRGSSAPTLDFEPAAEPFLHPGRAAAVEVGGVAAGWLGELHPLVCRELGPRRRGRLRNRRRAAAGCRQRRRGGLRGRHHLPRRLPGPGGRRARPRSPRPRSAPRCSPAAASCCTRAEVFDLFEGEQLGEGRKSLALGLEFRAPDRTLDRRGGRRRARGDQGRAGRRSGGRCVNELDAQPLSGEPAARVLVAGANGFTGALAAQIVWDHPRLRAGRGDLAQRRRQAARRALPALPGAARADRARPRRARPEVDAAIVAYPHGAAAPTVAALRAAGDPGRRPLRRLPAARHGHLRALVRRARRAGAVRHRRLRADRDVPRGAARGGAGRDARLLPDRDRARRWRRWPNRGCSARSSSAPCRAPPATAAAATTSSTSRR